ncbi:MAG: hypothetical protein ABWW65_07965 [Thermoprotei archaeon]
MDIAPHAAYRIDYEKYYVEYILYPDNVLEIVYRHKKKGTERIHVVYFRGFISTRVIDCAVKITRLLLPRVRAGISKPNIPLYALLYSIILNTSGFGYKCKVKTHKCPLKIYRIERGRRILLSIGSVAEQTYRVMRPYRELIQKTLNITTEY